MSQSEMSCCSNDDEFWKLPEQDFTWDVTSELALYRALITHKPAGINKHFSVALVSEKLSEQLGKPVLPNSIWNKLRTLFDLSTIDEREETAPFLLEEKEFALPKREFESLILYRQKEWREKCQMKHVTPTRTPSTPKSEGSVGSRRSSPVLKDKYELDEEDDDDRGPDHDDTDSDGDQADAELDQLDVSTRSKEDDIERKNAFLEEKDEMDSDTEQTRDKDRGKEDKLKEKAKNKDSGKGSKDLKKGAKEDESKSTVKRHITRSTPNSTPSKRRK